jgi:hypothetical protein
MCLLSYLVYTPFLFLNSSEEAKHNDDIVNILDDYYEMQVLLIVKYFLYSQRLFRNS